MLLLLPFLSLPFLSSLASTLQSHRFQLKGSAFDSQRGGGKFLEVALRCARGGAAAVVFTNTDNSIVSMSGPEEVSSAPAPAPAPAPALEIEPDRSQIPLSPTLRASSHLSPLRRASPILRLTGEEEGGGGGGGDKPKAQRQLFLSPEEADEKGKERQEDGEQVQEKKEGMEGRTREEEEEKRRKEDEEEKKKGEEDRLVVVPHWFPRAQLVNLEILSLCECRWVNDSLMMGLMRAMADSQGRCR
eukprot:745807-Hanusia_phi.AAC.1